MFVRCCIRAVGRCSADVSREVQRRAGSTVTNTAFASVQDHSQGRNQKKEQSQLTTDGYGLGMHHLLPLVNDLQDVFSRISMVNKFDLPRIVVVGAQSSGKSSVLENIVGKDFLPRGSGIVTRCPLILQMTHLGKEEHDRRLAANEPTETATFFHKKGQIYTDFVQVKEEIEKVTIEKCGSSGVASDPIQLSVTSNYVLDLTLIDLPGLTKNNVNGQEISVVADIENMVKSFVDKKNTIILAVSAANADIANSDALQMARRVDPNGERTIGVLTKIDLMDDGTDCLKVLNGETYPLKKGFYGLVNRSQKDIDESKDIKAALAKEKDFFEKHPVYGPYASTLGTPYLTKVLSQELMTHIKKVLPQLRANLAKLTEETDEALRKLGSPPSDEDKRTVLLRLLQEYSDTIISNLVGSKIHNLCYEVFVPKLRELQTLNELTDTRIQEDISCSQNTHPTLFFPTEAIRYCVRKSIKNLHNPSMECVNAVHTELLALIEKALPVINRFPNLKSEVGEFTKGLFAEYREPLVKFIENLIQMEMAHMNTNHSAFYNGGSLDELISKAVPGRADNSRWFSFGFRASRDQQNDKETAERVMKTIVRHAVTVYMPIVNSHLQDHVPKAISYFFVGKLKADMNNALITEFVGNKVNVDQLLKEDEDIARQRKTTQDKLDCLRKAKDALDVVRDHKAL